MAKEQMRYSEAFKAQVVCDLERGRFRGPTEASEHYGIKGTQTVKL